MEKAKTDNLKCRLIDIPFIALQKIGEIFQEGAIKYGVGNWKKGVGDKEFQGERANHAIRHLMLWVGSDRGEEHLAKVAWFCITQLWIEGEEKKIKTLGDGPIPKSLVSYPNYPGQVISTHNLISNPVSLAGE